MNRLDFVRLEAIRLLEEIEMFDISWVDIFKIIDKLGNVYDITLIGKDLASLDGFTQKYNGRYLLAYDNVNYPETRIRFSIAHEIGHIWLDHLDSELTACDWYRKKTDKEANAFAAELLMPRFILHDYNAMHKKDVASTLRVSEASLGYRIENLSKIQTEYSVGFCPYCNALIYNKGRVKFCGACGVEMIG